MFFGVALGVFVFALWERAWARFLRRSQGMMRAGMPAVAAGATGVPIFLLLAIAAFAVGTPAHVGATTFVCAACAALLAIPAGFWGRTKERRRIIQAMPAARGAVERLCARNSALLVIPILVAVVLGVSGTLFLLGRL
ncbi:MAG: hypothetical protein JST00_06485 [Deltaproteobacteria bacterium]|nr:hypothetical protein [Deltaproteobacteria bacterium]